jgi:acyl-CoA synthetase (AMP-forming)/AMP-acid ligase II
MISQCPSPIAAYCSADFGTFPELFALQAQARGAHPAVICGEQSISYAALDRLVSRVAASLQRDGFRAGEAVAICAASSIRYVAAFIGIVRAGGAVTPLSPSATAEQLSGMLSDCGARLLFADEDVLASLANRLEGGDIAAVALDGPAFEGWLVQEEVRFAPVTVSPDQPFNIIYSSGTTGLPKGIVQSHRMRWPHCIPGEVPGFGPDAVTIVSTPLYSNTTLVSLLPTLAGGGTAVLMPGFDVLKFLELSERHGATHAMLVPVQYRRIMKDPRVDTFDLSSYRLKFATSAPFPAELKAEVLRRWPGGLIEYYGMTEGGGTCALVAHAHPDKLHTVGRPLPGHDMKVISNEGAELAPGMVGEVVGRSQSVMTGYHNRPDQTAAAEWRSPDGTRYIRTGDLASVDQDGFFTLVGRKKDMIISGGMNIYPADLEQLLVQHPSIEEAAVVGVASARWGETPIAFVTVRQADPISRHQLLNWANQRLGKMQRLSDLHVIDELPRSAIGKVLKRELQASYAALNSAPAAAP